MKTTDNNKLLKAYDDTCSYCGESHPQYGAICPTYEQHKADDAQAEKETPMKTTDNKLNYTPTEKRAAQIVDQLCPVIANETGRHVGPKLFDALTVRLAELLGADVCQHCSGTGLDKAHTWPDGTFASREHCEGYGTT